MRRSGSGQIKLKDRYSGHQVWLNVRDGRVVGAMGSDPQRYVGMTIAEARHHARHGGRPLRVSAHSTKRQTSGTRIDRKRLGEMMSPWGSDFAYGEGGGAIGAVSSYYYSGMKYPERRWVERALAQVEADAPKAEHGAHGWTKSDARDLRRIAAGLRYYLHHDYDGGGSSHSTVKRGRSHATIAKRGTSSRAELVDVARAAAAAVFEPRKVAPSEAAIKKARSAAFRAIQRHDRLTGTAQHPVAAYAHGIAELAAEGTEEARRRWAPRRRR